MTEVKSQNLENTSSKVFLVGPLPPPIGGVSSHIAGLANLLTSHSIECTVIDSYPSQATKTKLPKITHLICKGPLRYLKVLYLLCKQKKQKTEIIHFHFSGIIGKILFVALLLPRFDRKFFLTIHHGNQNQIFNSHNWLLKYLAKLAVRRMDTIFALSQTQLEFFLSINIPQKKITRWTIPAIFPTTAKDELLPANIRALQAVEDGGSISILLASGYANEHYQFEDCLKLLSTASKAHPCCLIICFYGISQNKNYEKQLRKELALHKNVYLVESLPADGFNALLRKASVYLRPSKVDSYGLAITEALNQGVPSIASDICDRDSRCITYPAGNYNKFEELSLEIIQQGQSLKARPKIEILEVDRDQKILEYYS